MRIDDIIFFAPGIRAIDIDFDNKEQIIVAFESRVNNFYLEPANQLNESQHAFAAGVILMTAIDAIMYYNRHTKNPISDFFETLPAFRNYFHDMGEEEIRKAAYRIEDHFRNGLIHEGRIKNCGQFSYDYAGALITVIDEFIILNPKILFEEVSNYCHRYFQRLQTGNIYEIFITKLRRQFYSEIERLKALH